MRVKRETESGREGERMGNLNDEGNHRDKQSKWEYLNVLAGKKG